MERDHEQIKHLKYILRYIKTLRDTPCKRNTCRFQDTLCPLKRFARSVEQGTLGKVWVTENLKVCTYQSPFHTMESILDLNNTIEEVEKMILMEMI